MIFRIETITKEYNQASIPPKLRCVQEIQELQISKNLSD